MDTKHKSKFSRTKHPLNRVGTWKMTEILVLKVCKPMLEMPSILMEPCSALSRWKSVWTMVLFPLGPQFQLAYQFRYENWLYRELMGVVVDIEPSTAWHQSMTQQIIPSHSILCWWRVVVLLLPVVQIQVLAPQNKLTLLTSAIRYT